MSMKKIDRRETLKMMAAAPLVRYLPAVSSPSPVISGSGPNILIIVFDALSALNMDVYRYPRQTMPNLARFLSRSTVYHHHYASAPFTTPGTASLLTGTYAHTHRAIHKWGIAEASFAQKNLFNLFQGYHRVAYTHNPLADRLLDQFTGLDQHVPRQKLYLGNDFITGQVFSRDYNLAATTRREALQANDGYAFSLFFSNLQSRYYDWLGEKYKDQFPRGLSIAESNHLMILDTAIDWLIQVIGSFEKPFLGYFHFWPPHGPYNTRREFIDVFKDDGFSPVQKARHILSQGESQFMLDRRRWTYDEFILYVDAEFKRLYDQLETDGVLENTWLVFTSDHGEMFERGFFGHTSPSLHQPVLRIPLIVSAPGQRQRQDIYTPTSAVDLVPTLLNAADFPIPDWVEGQVLPNSQRPDNTASRPIYALMADDNPEQFGPLQVASTMLLWDGYKLTCYQGYDALEGDQLVELYRLGDDPEEMVDLSREEKERVKEMLAKIKGEVMDSQR